MYSLHFIIRPLLCKIYLIYIISLCIELDIPLKSLKQYIKNAEIIDYAGLLETGKNIAKQKIEILTGGLKLIDQIEDKIEQTDKYPYTGEIYSREIKEKY